MDLTVVSQENGCNRVRCAGFISVPDFGVELDPLERVLGRECYAQKILLNLESAGSIDSSGVSWLIRSHRRCGEHGGLFVVHSIPPMIMHVLGLLRMDKILALADDGATAEAIAARGSA